MNNIYNEIHNLVFLSSNGTEKRLTAKVEIDVPSGLSQKELYLKLTDEDNMSFLFCLKINNENFQEIKSQQGLLVDYSAFGQKLMDLFSMCKNEEINSNPKYIIKLCGDGDFDKSCTLGCNWTLNFVETNPFKHLIHLSLRLQFGDSEQFKEYLVQCLKKYKTDNNSLAMQLEDVQTELSRKLKETEEKLSQTQSELHQQEINLSAQIEDLKKKEEQLISKNKTKLMETEQYYRTKFEQDKQTMEQSFNSTVKSLEFKNADLEKTNKCLSDENSKLESDLREQKSRHQELELSYENACQEVQNLRKREEEAEKKIHDMECQNQRHGTRIAVLEQEVSDKDQSVARIQDLLNSEQESRDRYSTENQKKSFQIEKLEKAVKNMNDEVIKGNGIIQKLQNELKQTQNKVKVRTQITAEQEKSIEEKDKELQHKLEEIERLQKTVNDNEDEIKKLQDTVEQNKKRVAEMEHVIKTNENVINWLNRQVTEYELYKQQKKLGHMMGPTVENTVKYRPTSTIPTQTVNVNGDYNAKNSKYNISPPTGSGMTNHNNLVISKAPMSYLSSAIKNKQPTDKIQQQLQKLTVNENCEDSLHHQSLTSAYFPKPPNLLGAPPPK